MGLLFTSGFSLILRYVEVITPTLRIWIKEELQAVLYPDRIHPFRNRPEAELIM